LVFATTVGVATSGGSTDAEAAAADVENIWAVEAATDTELETAAGAAETTEGGCWVARLDLMREIWQAEFWLMRLLFLIGVRVMLQASRTVPIGV